MAIMKKFHFYWEEPYGRKEPTVIHIEIPGFRKDEITVNISSSRLEISASKKSRKVQRGKDFYREEAFTRSFSKIMSLPHGIRPEDFDLRIEDGSVTLKRKKKRVEAK